MIRVINILMLALFALSCNAGSESGAQQMGIDGGGGAPAVNVKQVPETTFSFYKSFPFCASMVAALTRSEADALYKDVEVNLEQADYSPSSLSKILDGEPTDCITDALELSADATVQLAKTTEEWPFGEVYVLEGQFVLAMRDGYFFAFRKGPATYEAPVTYQPKYKINDLPLSFGQAETNLLQVGLPKSGIELAENNFVESYLAFLPKVGDVNVAIFSGCYDFGNCDEFLVTFDASMREIDRLTLHFNEAPDGNVEKYSLATYEIAADYTVTVTTADIVEDLATGDVRTSKEEVLRYTIENTGRINPIN